jgi:uroporphyrinogen III methyltransferase / synthase
LGHSDAEGADVTVALVGAGPGDPGLITVRGAELLGRAQCVVYDRLVDARLLDLVPDDAERVYVGKAPGAVEMAQEDINALLVERGRQGARVVRLKGGDPFVFGRGGEEVEALAAAGVPFEVVPGITSAIAAPAYAGVPVTHRGLSTHVTIVTGHEDPAKGEPEVDWEAIGRAGGTLVILMGASRIGPIADRLMAAGCDPETPVVAVRQGTRADQQTVRTTLGLVAHAGIAPPSAIVVGAVAGLDLSWFEQRPLFRRSVVVTRAREQASELRMRLEALGAEVVELPTIAIAPLEITLPNLADYAWIAFTSTNGVEAFFEATDDAGLDTRALAGIRIAAIGPGTSAALVERGVRVDLLPERYVAESLVEAFPLPEAEGARVLVARADQARDVLPEGLVEKGYAVDVLPVYRTVTAEPDPAAVERVRAGDVDAITFTSSSTVTNLLGALGGLPAPQPKVVSIGPVTSETARQRGLEVDVEATEHTINGLVRAVVDAFDRSHPGSGPAPNTG